MAAAPLGGVPPGAGGMQPTAAQVPMPRLHIAQPQPHAPQPQTQAYPQQQQAGQQRRGPAKQVVVVVEGTASMGPSWALLRRLYLHPLLKAFCGVDSLTQRAGTAAVELALVVYHSHGSFSASLLQQTPFTASPAVFLSWLDALSFSGGGASDAAIAEGLSEALLLWWLGSSEPAFPGLVRLVCNRSSSGSLLLNKALVTNVTLQPWSIGSDLALLRLVELGYSRNCPA